MSSLRFVPGADWQLDAAAREIVRDGRRVRLAEKPFRVLQALVDARGEVVTRAALRARLWADDTFVDFDNNLNSAVATVRQALGGGAAGRIIETIPKVGYRLAIVEAPAAAAVEPPPRPVRWPRLAAALGALTVAGSLAALLAWPRVGPPAAAPVGQHREAQALIARGLYLRGQFVSGARDAAALTEAREALAAAMRLAPGDATAHAEDADTLIEMAFAGALRFTEALPAARDAARRALARDPRQGTAARVMGLAALFLDWDRAGARVWIDRAVAQRPDARTLLALATWHAAASEFEAAIAAAERAVALDPASLFVRADLAMFYLAAGRDGEAARSSREVLAVAPDFVPAHAQGLLAAERLGDWAQAAVHARALLRAHGGDDDALTARGGASDREVVWEWRHWDLARLERRAGDRRAAFALQFALRHAALGDHDAAIRELHRALDQRDALLVFLPSFPELVPLRGSAAFANIAAEVQSSKFKVQS